VRGAASLHVLPGAGCSLSDQYLDFPELGSGHPVTATQKVQAAEDGSRTAGGELIDVLCTWGDTDPWDSFDAVFTVGPPEAERFVNIGATIKPGEEALSGIVYSSWDRPASYSSSPEGPCVYTVIEADPVTRSIWGSVQCGVFSADDGSDDCVLGPSYFFFENCTLRTL